MYIHIDIFHYLTHFIGPNEYHALTCTCKLIRQEYRKYKVKSYRQCSKFSTSNIYMVQWTLDDVYIKKQYKTFFEYKETYWWFFTRRRYETITQMTNYLRGDKLIYFTYY